jgi:methyltransferase (TIGR00027 family)
MTPHDATTGSSCLQVRQLVVLGAGMDTRCYRFDLSKHRVRGFEVDLPAMSRKKRAALADAGIATGNTVYVELDFGAEPLVDALTRGGVDTSKPTLFVFEGVSMYLPKSTVLETLRTIARFAPGSSVVFDVLGDESNLLLSITRRFLAAKGEVFWFGCNAADLVALVQQAGLHVHALLTPDEIHASLLTRADGSLAARTLPYTSVKLVHAVV